MPIYEFLCPKCNAKTSILIRNVTAPVAGKCCVCGSSDLIRVISSFSYHRSVGTIWEESGEPRRHAGPDYYKDPRNIGRYVEKKFSELGVEVPSQIKEEIQAAREGELPKPLKEKL